MSNYLLLPPLAFIIVFIAAWIQIGLMSRMAIAGKTGVKGKGKAYACGEDVENNRINPDYSQFFPFAFFFTIMHVVALIVATVPAAATKFSLLMAVLYLVVAIVSLFILFRR